MDTALHRHSTRDPSGAAYQTHINLARAGADGTRAAPVGAFYTVFFAPEFIAGIAIGVPLRAYLVCTVWEPRVSPAICGPFPPLLFPHFLLL